MSGTENRTKGGYRRRIFIVDKPLQYSIIFTVLGALMLVALMAVLANFVMPAGKFIGSLSGDQVRSLIIMLNAGCFAVTFITVGVIMVIISHRVAGPAMVIANALDGIREGDFGRRLKLRKRDYLKELALAVEDFRDDCMENASRRDQFLSELKASLESEDLAAARSLVEGYATSCAQVPEGSGVVEAPEPVGAA